jgi:sulfur carrier protein
MITVTINGEVRRFDEPLRFGELVERLGLAGKRIAIERNGEIVPRSEFSARSLGDGDRLEIVVAVGGG